jgi:hypothetical protein
MKINANTFSKLLEVSEKSFYRWKSKDHKLLINLIDKYFNESDIKEFIENGKINRFDKFENYINKNMLNNDYIKDTESIKFITKKYYEFIKDIVKSTDEDIEDKSELYGTDLYYIAKFIKEFKNNEDILNEESYQFGYICTYQEALINFIKKEQIISFRINNLLKLDEPSIIFIENFLIQDKDEIFGYIQEFDKRICYITLIMLLFIKDKINIEEFNAMYEIESEKDMLDIFEKEKSITPFIAKN